VLNDEPETTALDYYFKRSEKYSSDMEIGVGTWFYDSKFDLENDKTTGKRLHIRNADGIGYVFTDEERSDTANIAPSTYYIIQRDTISADYTTNSKEYELSPAETELVSSFSLNEHIGLFNPDHIDFVKYGKDKPVSAVISCDNDNNDIEFLSGRSGGEVYFLSGVEGEDDRKICLTGGVSSYFISRETTKSKTFEDTLADISISSVYEDTDNLLYADGDESFSLTADVQSLQHAVDLITIFNRLSENLDKGKCIKSAFKGEPSVSSSFKYNLFSNEGPHRYLLLSDGSKVSNADNLESSWFSLNPPDSNENSERCRCNCNKIGRIL
jgi:hypothetical protein